MFRKLSLFQDKLFPYVTENLESYLSTRYDEEETQTDIAALRALVISYLFFISSEWRLYV